MMKNITTEDMKMTKPETQRECVKISYLLTKDKNINKQVINVTTAKFSTGNKCQNAKDLKVSDWLDNYYNILLVICHPS